MDAFNEGNALNNQPPDVVVLDKGNLRKGDRFLELGASEESDLKGRGSGAIRIACELESTLRFFTVPISL